MATVANVGSDTIRTSNRAFSDDLAARNRDQFEAALSSGSAIAPIDFLRDQINNPSKSPTQPTLPPEPILVANNAVVGSNPLEGLYVTGTISPTVNRTPTDRNGLTSPIGFELYRNLGLRSEGSAAVEGAFDAGKLGLPTLMVRVKLGGVLALPPGVMNSLIQYFGPIVTGTSSLPTENQFRSWLERTYNELSGNQLGGPVNPLRTVSLVMSVSTADASGFAANFMRGEPDRLESLEVGIAFTQSLSGLYPGTPEAPVVPEKPGAPDALLWGNLRWRTTPGVGSTGNIGANWPAPPGTVDPARPDSTAPILPPGGTPTLRLGIELPKFYDNETAGNRISLTGRLGTGTSVRIEPRPPGENGGPTIQLSDGRVVELPPSLLGVFDLFGRLTGAGTSDEALRDGVPQLQPDLNLGDWARDLGGDLLQQFTGQRGTDLSLPEEFQAPANAALRTLQSFGYAFGVVDALTNVTLLSSFHWSRFFQNRTFANFRAGLISSLAPFLTSGGGLSLEETRQAQLLGPFISLLGLSDENISRWTDEQKALFVGNIIAAEDEFRNGRISRSQYLDEIVDTIGDVALLQPGSTTSTVDSNTIRVENLLEGSSPEFANLVVSRLLDNGADPIVIGQSVLRVYNQNKERNRPNEAVAQNASAIWSSSDPRIEVTRAVFWSLFGDFGANRYVTSITEISDYLENTSSLGEGIDSVRDFYREKLGSEAGYIEFARRIQLLANSLLDLGYDLNFGSTSLRDAINIARNARQGDWQPAADIDKVRESFDRSLPGRLIISDRNDSLVAGPVGGGEPNIDNIRAAAPPDASGVAAGILPPALVDQTRFTALQRGALGLTRSAESQLTGPHAAFRDTYQQVFAAAFNELRMRGASLDDAVARADAVAGREAYVAFAIENDFLDNYAAGYGEQAQEAIRQIVEGIEAGRLAPDALAQLEYLIASGLSLTQAMAFIEGAADSAAQTVAPSGVQTTAAQILAEIDSALQAAQLNGSNPAGTLALTLTRTIAETIAAQDNQAAVLLQGAGASLSQLLLLIGEGDLVAWGQAVSDLGRTLATFDNGNLSQTTGGGLSTIGSTLEAIGAGNRDPGLVLAGKIVRAAGSIVFAASGGLDPVPGLNPDGATDFGANDEIVRADAGVNVSVAAGQAVGGILQYLGSRNSDPGLIAAGTVLNEGFGAWSAYANNQPGVGDAAVARAVGAALQQLIGDDAGRVLGAAGSITSTQMLINSGRINPAVGYIQIAQTALSALGVNIPAPVNFATNLIATTAVGGPLAWGAFAVGFLFNLFGMGTFSRETALQDNIDADGDGFGDDNVGLRQEFRRGFFGNVHQQNHHLIYDVNGVNPLLLQNVNFSFRPEIITGGVFTPDDGDIMYLGSQPVVQLSSGEFLNGYLVTKDGSHRLDAKSGYDGMGDHYHKVPEAYFHVDPTSTGWPGGQTIAAGTLLNTRIEAVTTRKGDNYERVVVEHNTGNMVLDISANYGAINPSVAGESVSTSVVMSPADYAAWQAQLGGDAGSMTGADPRVANGTLLASLLDGQAVRFAGRKNDPNLYQYLDMNGDGTPDLVRIGLQMDGLQQQGDGRIEVTLLDRNLQPTMASYTADSFLEAEEIGLLSDALTTWGASNPEFWDYGKNLGGFYRAARDSGQLDPLKQYVASATDLQLAFLTGNLDALANVVAQLEAASQSLTLRFNPTAYAALYPDVAAWAGGVQDAGTGAWEGVDLHKATRHYFDHGNSEGRTIDQEGTVLARWQPGIDFNFRPEILTGDIVIPEDAYRMEVQLSNRERVTGYLISKDGRRTLDLNLGYYGGGDSYFTLPEAYFVVETGSAIPPGAHLKARLETVSAPWGNNDDYTKAVLDHNTGNMFLDIAVRHARHDVNGHTSSVSHLLNAPEYAAWQTALAPDGAMSGSIGGFDPRVAPGTLGGSLYGATG